MEQQGEVLTDFRANLRAAKRGNQDAFAVLWAEFQPSLLRYLTVKAGAGRRGPGRRYLGTSAPSPAHFRRRRGRIPRLAVHDGAEPTHRLVPG